MFDSTAFLLGLGTILAMAFATWCMSVLKRDVSIVDSMWPLIATTFTFRQGGFDGELKRYRPRGFVSDERSNAVWGMQFVWPFKGDFRIVYLDADYTQTVIGREKRDYVWIMARQPTMPEADYQRVIDLLDREGYDTTKIRKVPQRWVRDAGPETRQ